MSIPTPNATAEMNLVDRYGYVSYQAGKRQEPEEGRDERREVARAIIAGKQRYALAVLRAALDGNQSGRANMYEAIRELEQELKREAAAGAKS